MVITLSRNEYFCKIFDIPISEEETEELANNTMYKTMADVEMVVRFFAMRYLDEYEGITLKVFFDKFTDSANKLSQSVLDDYQHVFEQTIKLVFDIYGEQAFCLYKQISGKEQWYLTRNPKKTIYDPVMTVLSQKLDYADSFLKNKDQVMAATIELMKNQPELFNGRKGTKSDIAKRIDAFDAMFNKFIQ